MKTNRVIDIDLLLEEAKYIKKKINETIREYSNPYLIQLWLNPAEERLSNLYNLKFSYESEGYADPSLIDLERELSARFPVRWLTFFNRDVLRLKNNSKKILNHDEVIYD